MTETSKTKEHERGEEKASDKSNNYKKHTSLSDGQQADYQNIRIPDDGVHFRYLIHWFADALPAGILII